MDIEGGEVKKGFHKESGKCGGTNRGFTLLLPDRSRRVNGSACLQSPYNCKLRASGGNRIDDAAGYEDWTVSSAYVLDGNGDPMILQTPGKLKFNYGQARVMDGQLHLLAMSEKPNILILIVPGPISSAASRGSFVLATLPDRSEIAYADMAARDVTLDDPEDIRAISDRYDEIRDLALPAEMSRRLIEQTMEERWAK